ncbi:sulfur oxidation protein SoxZ [Hyphomicrobium denitrificans 1NES1]|uniref:Sulfur oxidation protein SoxZ n=1 Tax=Hyphomicrobium denitrificans 1NES1 TaxID=670307 RepID=N0B9T2_9HYPH|nr:quinoprotein dehydrogenase-associated SoxYZ-like carrier [Hyphomicrobium denitrificans]AGK56865.1 sulfur oxidation protein SoxZ [Hyphomicrobium denitrificans 1NES1]
MHISSSNIRAGRAKAVALTATAVLIASVALCPAGARADDDPWPSIQQEMYGSRPIKENDGIVILDAPERAEDAAVVPITIRVPPTVKGQLKSMALIIDRNPAPVAANISFGPASGDGGGERRMSTRVRIDMYTYVHAVVETSDGVLHMTKAFVKASGGCSAPAPKDTDADTADLGKMVVKSFDPALETTPLREGQFMIKHPNNNGMQMDQLTHGYIPARFIKNITVMRGNDLVFKAETGFSIATNPNFRFTYANSRDNAVEVEAIDTDEIKFAGTSGKAVASQ